MSRAQPIWARRETGARRLHLGCFDRPLTGWINTDVSPHVWLARIPFAARAVHALGGMSDERYLQHRRGLWQMVERVDVSKRFPYADCSMDSVYSTHLLEHLPRGIATNCLRESYRVLAPGGVIRVGVPDLDLYVREYDPTDPNAFVYRLFEAEHAMDKNRHWWMYNETSLAAVLRDAGFVESVRRSYQQGDCPDVQMLDNRPDITLFMEARRAL